MASIPGFSRRHVLAACAGTAVLPWLRGGARAEAADPALAARALLAAYPLDVVAVEDNAVVLASGRRMTVDDGRDKDFDARLADADLQDMFHDLYPWGAEIAPPAHNVDPGRYRNDALFRAIYGETQAEVAAQLVSVDWLAQSRPTRLRVHAKYAIADRLARISARLEALGPEFLPMLESPGGTFNWRTIAGTDRLSAHSFGISIDINTAFADYWRWSGGGADPTAYRNRIAPEIVEIFEAEDFIWGGRWYHYDTMHFEYRPELRHYHALLAAR